MQLIFWQQKNNFCSQANYFLARFSFLPIILECKLFVNFCYALYGCQLWDLGLNKLKHSDTIRQIVIRPVWGLPPPLIQCFYHLSCLARVVFTLLYLVFIILLLIVFIAVILVSCLWHAMRDAFLKVSLEKNLILQQMSVRSINC